MSNSQIEQVERRIFCRDRLARCLAQKLERLAPASDEYARAEAEIVRLRAYSSEAATYLRGALAAVGIRENLSKPHSRARARGLTKLNIRAISGD